MDHLLQQSRAFLKAHPDLLVVPADKSGRTVILNKSDYTTKMYTHLNENLVSRNYASVKDFEFPLIRQYVEQAYKQLINEINPFFTIDGCKNIPFFPEPHVCWLLYGCPKVHKPTVPMRPIVAAVNGIGSHLSAWLLEKLSIIAGKFDKYNVNDTLSLIPELRNFHLEPDYVLCSLDYESMVHQYECRTDNPDHCGTLLVFYACFWTV